MASTTLQHEPPGEIIREELDARGWTQNDLAQIMGRPLAAVNEIVNGKRKITTKTAAELEEAFDVEAQFWLNLEAAYQLSQVKVTGGENLRAKLMNFAPITEMQKRGWLPKTKDIDALYESVKSFFSVENLDDTPLLAGAFRQSSGDVNSAHVAWCIAVINKARAQKVAAFRVTKIQELQSKLRELAAHAEGVKRVPRLLSDYGIRFVIAKHLQSTKIDGATLWLDTEQKKEPVIALSLRYGRIDNFWHTLCHELSHVENRDSFKIDLDIATAKAGKANDPIEDRANADAASMLIPPSEMDSFILRKKPYFSSKSIVQFANRIRIHPGIIVGQLQYREAIKYTHSKDMLKQIRDDVLETSISDGWIK